MDDLISLAIHIGKLEQRIEALEKNSQKNVVIPPMEETVEDNSERLFQQGIDNILGYQWPPVKKDGDE